MNAAEALWGLDNRAAFVAALNYLPFGWKVVPGDDRMEFRFPSIRGKEYYTIRWRRTKPEGWVCFHATGARPIATKAGKVMVPMKEKKMFPQSFPNPVAAATAIHLAGGV